MCSLSIKIIGSLVKVILFLDTMDLLLFTRNKAVFFKKKKKISLQDWNH